MRRPERRLAARLLAWLLAPLILLLVIDTALAWSHAQRQADATFDRALQLVARDLVLHVRSDGGRLRLEVPDGLALSDDGEDRVFFRVRAADGTVLGGNASLPEPALSATAAPQFFDQQVGGEPVRVLALRVPLAKRGPLVDVLLAETLHQRRRLAWALAADVLWPQLLLVAVAALVVWFGVVRGLAPLARTFEFQQRFVADAAHQLKTPVSGLKAQIELALRETDPQRVRHSLGQLATSVDRLSRLVRQLLSLARNEPGALQTIELQPLDLRAFALDVSMEWVPHAIGRNIDLGFEGEDTPLVIDADRDRLRELVNNLIDNAIRYSQPGGRVTVRTAAVGEADVQLAISDDGPHIPVAERARIFERFHRLLGTPEDGSGLGLAIVRDIATLHRARITLEEDTDGIGNTFSVWFRRSEGAVSL